MSDYMEIARRALERHQHGQADPECLEAILKGSAIELWSDLAGERLFIVADEEDARLLGEPRGQTYTAAEARRVCTISDPKIVREIHRYKRKLDAIINSATVERARATNQAATAHEEGR